MKKQTNKNQLYTVLARVLLGALLVVPPVLSATQTASYNAQQRAQREAAAKGPVKKLCWGDPVSPTSRRSTQRQVVSNLTEGECNNWHTAQTEENRAKGYGADTVHAPDHAVTVCWEPCPSRVFNAPTW